MHPWREQADTNILFAMVLIQKRRRIGKRSGSSTAHVYLIQIAPNRKLAYITAVATLLLLIESNLCGRDSRRDKLNGAVSVKATITHPCSFVILFHK